MFAECTLTPELLPSSHSYSDLFLFVFLFVYVLRPYPGLFPGI